MPSETVMPAIHATGQDEEDIEVLVTGFGPFGRFSPNPSWSCAKDLHDLSMPLSQPPSAQSNHAGKDAAESAHARGPERYIHIQSIMTPTVYSHVLDLVPRIHGNAPGAPEAERWVDPRGPQPDASTGESAQGNGKPFPDGFRGIDLPKSKQGKTRPFDIVLHIGVGFSGAIALETLGHKRGFDKPDARHQLAPEATDQNPVGKPDMGPSEAELRELNNVINTNGKHRQGYEQSFASQVRGFGRGYEQFGDEEATNEKAVASIVQWLSNESQFRHIKQSHDAGRYLCDYIFYCSLCEAKRASAPTFVQFVHIPPPGDPYSTRECTDVIKHIIWYLAQRTMVGESARFRASQE